MSVTENLNENEVPIESVLNQTDSVINQFITPEQLAPNTSTIQQDIHETDYEDDSKITFKDIIVSSLIFLSFAALLVLVYIVLPS